VAREESKLMVEEKSALLRKNALLVAQIEE